MELWIRSQDKERLIRVGNLYVEYNGDVDPNIHTYRIVTDKFIEIGLYKSKERALEVLDEIQIYLTPTISMLDDRINDKQVCQIGNILTMIYQMPKE